MTTRSVTLAVGTVSVARDSAVFTCPNGSHTIVKNIRLYNPSATATKSVAIYLARPSVANVTIITETLTANLVYSADLWIILEPGDALVFVSSPFGATYWVSGALLPVGST